ncbi:hypothetical protein [Asticcacaulis sp. EMRT-3]|uniref:hypothetical protein n=1 Tax=Asticcacaulis sp. EMRT-3 TaxID=3040349 RepID=UPI0024AEB786|nr:hypothetical protein [Asticcacaulis sp. EMRT-3]MDI7776168.1 hypothetical protein [Asticcacaulis sp. EMRT-3]
MTHDNKNSAAADRAAKGNAGIDPETGEGRKVFSPGELNNAGEDKEYFHPDKDHKFEVPKDANKHALKPDVEVAPGNTLKPQT